MPKKIEPSTLSEMEIKKLIQEEIKQCFEEISSDVKDIKKALLGDGVYQKTGLVSLVQRHEDYIDKSETLKIIERAQPALEWYESWSKEGIFKQIKDILDTYGKLKWFVGLIAGGSLAGIVSTILLLLDIIKGFR